MTLEDENYLIDYRSDPEHRMVLEDLRQERGAREYRLGVALEMISSSAETAAAADADAADDVSDAASDAEDAADASVDSDTADAAGFAVVADAHAVTDAAFADAEAAAIRRRVKQSLDGDNDMRDGLKIIAVPGSYGYSVVRVGWVRRTSGDEFDLLPGAMTIVRASGSRTIDSIASKGPMDDHVLTDPSETTEELHRLLVRRSFVASDVWLQYCPRPADWSES